MGGKKALQAEKEQKVGRESGTVRGIEGTAIISVSQAAAVQIKIDLSGAGQAMSTTAENFC